MEDNDSPQTLHFGFMKKSKEQSQNENKTTEAVFNALEYADAFRTWQRHDKLCAGAVALSPQWFRP